MKFCPGDLVELSNPMLQSWTYVRPFKTFSELARASLSRAHGVINRGEVALVVATVRTNGDHPENVNDTCEKWVAVIDARGCPGYIREFLINRV